MCLQDRLTSHVARHPGNFPFMVHQPWTGFNSGAHLGDLSARVACVAQDYTQPISSLATVSVHRWRGHSLVCHRFTTRQSFFPPAFGAHGPALVASVCRAPTDFAELSPLAVAARTPTDVRSRRPWAI